MNGQFALRVQHLHAAGTDRDPDYGDRHGAGSYVAATLAASMALPADTDHDSGEARAARATTHWARNGPLAMALRT